MWTGSALSLHIRESVSGRFREKLWLPRTSCQFLQVAMTIGIEQRDPIGARGRVRPDTSESDTTSPAAIKSRTSGESVGAEGAC